MEVTKKHEKLLISTYRNKNQLVVIITGCLNKKKCFKKNLVFSHNDERNIFYRLSEEEEK